MRSYVCIFDSWKNCWVEPPDSKRSDINSKDRDEKMLVHLLQPEAYNVKMEQQEIISKNIQKIVNLEKIMM